MCEVCEERYKDEDEARQVVCFPNGDKVVWVAVYELNRVSGGPEEGGWWYNTGDMVELLAATNIEEGNTLAADLRIGKYKDEDGPNLYSVAYRGGNYAVNVYDDGKIPWGHWPVVRPHYE